MECEDQLSQMMREFGIFEAQRGDLDSQIATATPERLVDIWHARASWFSGFSWGAAGAEQEELVN